MRRGGIQCRQRGGGIVARQCLLGEQHRPGGGVACAQRFGMRGGRGLVAARVCGACRMRARHRFGIARIRGLHQQLLGARVLAALVGEQAFAELRPCLPLPVPLPRAERQPQQVPGQHRENSAASRMPTPTATVVL